MDTRETGKGVQDLLSELQALRDQLRVQIHLAGMEAEKEWDAIEEKWHLMSELAALRDEARVRAHLGSMEAKEQLEQLTDKVDHVADMVEREVSSEVKELANKLSAKMRRLLGDRPS